jgi:uncharacterized protein (TIGR02217 family)
MTVYPVYYPDLPGLTFSVIKRPKFYNSIAIAASGREVRVGYAQFPRWEWDLTYDYLPDKQTGSSATSSDLRDLLGFYLSCTGTLSGFVFLDPDDCTVSAQFLGTGDGTTTTFPLIRSFGLNGFYEPVGYVDPTGFVGYVNGVASACGIDSSIPCNQTVTFSTAPASGAIVTCDMNYYFYVRFKEDTTEYEKFMDKLWSSRLITLISLRDGPPFAGSCG